MEVFITLLKKVKKHVKVFGTTFIKKEKEVANLENLDQKVHQQQRPLKEGGSAAWTRKEGKSPSGGLNQKGRDSYKGGTLKAPTKSKTSGRRKSFCARMGGMKKKLTSAKTARDPNSRINKSLRKWDC